MGQQSALQPFLGLLKFMFWISILLNFIMLIIRTRISYYQLYIAMYIFREPGARGCKATHTITEALAYFTVWMVMFFYCKYNTAMTCQKSKNMFHLSIEHSRRTMACRHTFQKTKVWLFSVSLQESRVFYCGGHFNSDMQLNNIVLLTLEVCQGQVCGCLWFFLHLSQYPSVQSQGFS